MTSHLASPATVPDRALREALPTLAEVDARLHERRVQLAVKRALDVLLSALLLIVLGPLLLCVALLIRLDSPGPVLFAQPRWGLRERTFRCLKLRSMRVGPPPALAGRALDELQRGGVLAKMERDPRVTRIGRVIRRASIDELPQLWNVLRGDMSLVGPRPLMLHMLEPYPELRAVRCRVRPGITGLWQVNDRANNTHVASMLRHDLEYLQRVGLATDARILARTVRAVLAGEGAV